jgi:hypothetical protein
MSSRDVRIVCPRPKWITSADKRMCRASCKKTYKCVTRQQCMGEQSRLSTWPDVNVLNTGSNCWAHALSSFSWVNNYEFPSAFSLIASLSTPIQCTSFINWHDMPLRWRQYHTSLKSSNDGSSNFHQLEQLFSPLHPSMQLTLFFHPPTCRLRDTVRSLPLRNALAPNISLAPLDSACFDLTLHLSPSDSLQPAAGAVSCLRIATNFLHAR